MDWKLGGPIGPQKFRNQPGSVFVSRTLFVLLPSLILLGAPFVTMAHGGRTNAQGCHNQRATGDYHCHGGSAPTFSPPIRTPRSDSPYANCAAARAAGAAPVRRGDAGYGAHLDRDGDGVGCE